MPSWFDQTSPSDVLGQRLAWPAPAGDFCRRPLPAESRWIARSALQKAIRRGETERALEIGLGLLGVNPDYTWRALLTVALEDVGFGSPECVLWATAARLKPFRDASGETVLLAALIREMCAAPKTRSACDLSYLIDEGSPELLRRFSELSTSALLQKVEANDPQETYAALAVLRGVVPAPFKTRPPDREGVLQACEIMRAQLPLRHARAAAMAYMRPLDNLSIGIFPAARMGQQVDDPEIIQDLFPTSMEIEGYPSEAYDQHERVGRRAIRALSAELRTEAATLAALSANKAFSAVADALFLVEGALLDRRVSGGELEGLRSASDELTMTRHGLTPEQGLAVREIVRTSIPRLNEHRRRLAAA